VRHRSADDARTQDDIRRPVTRARRALALLTLTTVGAVPLRAADSQPLVRLLQDAGAYVRSFEDHFALVISDEDYRQHATGQYYPAPRNRRTQSEMLFFWMPDAGTWLTVRNVQTADGRTVVDSQNRLQRVLGDNDAERLTRLRRLLDESARFNLGAIVRNFNYPTLVLSYLDPSVQSRFVFTVEGRERVNGVDAWKIAYEERARPTVIQQDGADRESRGAIWMTDRDGIVVRTRLELRLPLRETISAIEVDYRRDAKLDMWVPARMHETYLHSRAMTIAESIDCVATYSNFRRFETSGRIVK
jgi:hypothetical protein